MYTVKLNDLKYYAFHGLFPQEAKVGNEFYVSMSVSLPQKLELENDINNLLNYVSLKDIVDEQMKTRFLLLEDLLAKIKADVTSLYPQAQGSISIKKMQPPFGGRCHSSQVILTF